MPVLTESKPVESTCTFLGATKIDGNEHSFRSELENLVCDMYSSEGVSYWEHFENVVTSQTL